jgi:cytochrome c556
MTRIGPTLDEQIQCARRELGMRERVYRRWVQMGKMTQNNADYEIECMNAILTTLQKLAPPLI